MCENTYTVMCGGAPLGHNLTMEAALILIRGMFETYYRDTITLVIYKEDNEVCNNG